MAYVVLKDYLRLSTYSYLYTARWLEVGYNEGEFVATVSEGPEAHIVLDVIRLSNFRADMEKRTDEGFICKLRNESDEFTFHLMDDNHLECLRRRSFWLALFRTCNEEYDQFIVQCNDERAILLVLTDILVIFYTDEACDPVIVMTVLEAQYERELGLITRTVQLITDSETIKIKCDDGNQLNAVLEAIKKIDTNCIITSSDISSKSEGIGDSEAETSALRQELEMYLLKGESEYDNLSVSENYQTVRKDRKDEENREEGQENSTWYANDDFCEAIDVAVDDALNYDDGFYKSYLEEMENVLKRGNTFLHQKGVLTEHPDTFNYTIKIEEMIFHLMIEQVDELFFISNNHKLYEPFDTPEKAAHMIDMINHVEMAPDDILTTDEALQFIDDLVREYGLSLEAQPAPDVTNNYGGQWFWPNLTYSQAEELVRAHLSSVFVVRKSESILGDLALTSGVGPRHNKKVKHHHIRSSQVDKDSQQYYVFCGALFSSLGEVLKYYVELNGGNIKPYFKPKNRAASMTSLNSGELCNTSVKRTNSYSTRAPRSNTGNSSILRPATTLAQSHRLHRQISVIEDTIISMSSGSEYKNRPGKKCEKIKVPQLVHEYEAMKLKERERLTALNKSTDRKIEV